MKNALMLTWVSLVVVGCSQPSATTTPGGDAAGTAPAASSYLAESEPIGAMPVGQARESVKDNEPVTVVGLIGGSTEPFVDGLAAFTIVDSKVPYCAPEEGCPTPWDYCCETDAVKVNIAMVKVVDNQGNPVASDARALLNVKELSTVVIEGTARRDDQGNLTVAATRVFVRSGE